MLTLHIYGGAHCTVEICGSDLNWDPTLCFETIQNHGSITLMKGVSSDRMDIKKGL